MPGPSGRMGVTSNPETRGVDVRASGSRVCVGAMGVGLAGRSVLSPDTVFQTPPQPPQAPSTPHQSRPPRVEQARVRSGLAPAEQCPARSPLHPWMTRSRSGCTQVLLCPAPPRLPLRRGGHAPGRQRSRGSRPTAPQTAAGQRRSGGPASALSLRFLLRREVHCTLSWGDEPQCARAPSSDIPRDPGRGVGGSWVTKTSFI